MSLIVWRLEIFCAGYMCGKLVEVEFPRKFRVLSGEHGIFTISKSLAS